MDFLEKKKKIGGCLFTRYVLENEDDDEEYDA